MPRKVIAYACAFGCGRNVTTHKKAIIEHEKWCYWNPAKHACITCRFNERFRADSETGEPAFAACSIDKLPEGKKATIDCGWWEANRKLKNQILGD